MIHKIQSKFSDFKKDKSKSGIFQTAVDLTTKSAKLLGSVNHSPLGKLIVTYFRDVEQHHGVRTAIMQTKALYNEAIRFSCGLAVVPSTPIWIKRTKKDFLPIVLNQFRKPLRGSTLERRMALSYLRAFESIELAPVPNLETVVSPSKGADGFASILPSWNLFLKNSYFIKNLKESFKRECGHNLKPQTTTLHFSSKRGVEGPTCVTAGKQSQAISRDMAIKLSKLRSFFRNEAWIETLVTNRNFFADHPDLNEKPITRLPEVALGRITFIPDKGGKTRLIAIGNYWVQDSLLQLHRAIYGVLKHIPQDGTYEQGSQFERVREASSRVPTWSYDLTAATDRFPIGPQVSVLKSLHEEIGTLWESILKDLVFYYEGFPYTYRVGQPMGLYSSWAVFSLTHHVTIQYCAWLEGEKFPFESYAVLGDDVAIWSPGVAKRYREIINLFDVNISESKSFSPVSDSGPCVAEFAKRISDRGVEITPLSPDQNKEAWNSYWNWASYGSWLVQHGFDIGTVPISRIAKLSGLKPFQLRNLCCSLYIWEVLRAPTFAGVSDYLPEGFQSVATVRGIVNLRLRTLAEQASEFMDDLFGIYGNSNEVALEKRLAGSIFDELYITRIQETRISECLELEKALILFIPNEFSSDLVENEGDFPLPELSEIEYMPRVDLTELMRGITHHERKHILRNRYIQLLVKKAKECIKVDPNRVWMYSPNLFGPSAVHI